MNRVVIAFRAFFGALGDAKKAEQLQAALEGDVSSATVLPSPSIEAPNDERAKRLPVPARSDALSLLAALQREARLVDLVKQPLAGFADDQIGAAARAVLGDCEKVLDRFFALQPLQPGSEGEPCDVPAGYDPGRYKLSGRVEGSGPFHGQLVHHGWKATTVKLPEWSGSKDTALIIAPAEVEI